MNGDSRKIYDAIVDNGTRLTKLETLSKEQHKVNVKNIEEIKQDNKDCIKNHADTKGQIKGQWAILIGILTGLLSLAWSILR